jgi:hypothetical protein
MFQYSKICAVRSDTRTFRDISCPDMMSMEFLFGRVVWWRMVVKMQECEVQSMRKSELIDI